MGDTAAGRGILVTLAGEVSLADRLQVRHQSAQAIAHHAEISARSNRIRQHSDQLLARSRATRTISDGIHEKIRKTSKRPAVLRETDNAA